VRDWEGNERTIHFSTRLDAPAVITRMLGTEAIRVSEQQRRAFLPDGSIQLTSIPTPDIPGGARFTTQAVFTFSNAPAEDCCRVRGGAGREGRQRGCGGTRARLVPCLPACLPAYLCPAPLVYTR
jgi:hypothetical protein